MGELRLSSVKPQVAAVDSCPICCGQKSKDAVTCRGCYEKSGGSNATVAVKEVLELYEVAMEGHKKSIMVGGVPREIIFDCVLAQVEVPKDAVFQYPAENTGLPPYLTAKILVNGGFIEMFIFGATNDDRGKQVCGLVQGKTKLLKNKLASKGIGERQKSSYIRVEVLKGKKSDVLLGFNQGPYVEGLPQDRFINIIGKNTIICDVGFKPL